MDTINILWLVSTLSLVQGDNISNSLPLGKTIIFDITSYQNTTINRFTTMGDDQLVTSNYSSSLVYFAIDYHNQNDGFRLSGDHKQWHMNKTKMGFKIGYHKISGISFLLNSENKFQQYFQNITIPLRKEQVQEYMHSAGKIKALIFQVDPMYNNRKFCRCNHFSNGLMYLFQNTLNMNQSKVKSDIKYGVEYDEHLITCCQNGVFNLLEIVDLAVFVLPIKPPQILLSPNLFAEKIRSAMDKNRKFVRSVNSNLNVLIKIKLIKSEGSSDKLHYKYLAHIKVYLEYWLKTQPFDEQFILESFPENIEANTFYLQDVQPVLLESTKRIVNHHMEDFKSPCQMQYLLTTIYNDFDDFIYKPNSVESLNAIESKCTKYSNSDQFTKLRVNSISLLLSYGGSWEETLEEVVNQRRKRKGLRFETLFFKVPTSTLTGKNYSAHALNIGSYNQLVNFYIQRFGKIGCHVEVSNVELAVSLCGPLFRMSDALYIEWVVEESDIDNELPKVLLDLQNQRTLFKRLYPRKELFVGIMITNDYTNPFFEATLKRSVARQTLYCDNGLQKLYDSYNAILTFAEIHQLGKIVLQSAVHNGHVGGWWSSIETLKMVNRTATDFPLLVQRNLPSNIKAKLMLRNNIKCVQWSDSPDENGIKFKIFGGYVNLDVLKSLSLNKLEIQTLVLFTFSKFSFMEMIANDVVGISEFNKALSEELHSTVRPFCENKNYCYLLEIPFKSIIFDYQKILSKDAWKNSIGLHISLWEDNLPGEYKLFQNIIQERFWNISTNSTIIKIGVTITNCFDEINTQFIKLRSLPFINYVSYVVFNMPPIKPENYNQDTMQTFLDTQFYFQTYFHNFQELQNVRIYFRLNFLNEKCGNRKTEIESYLRLLNDLNEHSKTYGITYIVNAFQQTKSDCCTAWWQINNASDLTKLSAYVERESEYFDRPTQLKLILNSTRDTNIIIDKSQSFFVIIISSGILFVLLSVVLALWYRLKTVRKRFLTDDEENIFRHGHVYDNDPEITNLLERLKFDKNFEIERDNIQLRKYIGKGRFGHVYKSILNNELEVAVKLPHGECLKEAFISMLAEVKILCYVGYHPFVVGFIGAYTQDIRRGKLYIVTEYCEHGSLQSYLHTKKLKTKVDLKDASVDMYQFCSFAYQIAKGMSYIGEKNVIHGDLSTRNVLLTGELVCKIGDFGLSRRLYENVEYVKKTKEPLPWRWLALESMKSRIFTTKSDVWSFGVAIWEIFTYGDLPYPSKEFTEEFIQEVENGLRLSKARYSNDSIHQKLMECWNTNSVERPDFEELATFFSALRRAEYDI